MLFQVHWNVNPLRIILHMVVQKCQQQAGMDIELKAVLFENHDNHLKDSLQWKGCFWRF